MFDRGNEGESCWTATAQLPVFGPLDRSLDVDVVIIGGGVTGITAAHLLKQSGVRVALLEQSRCGSGQTGRSTAHLTAVTDVPLMRLVDRLGAEQARAVWEAGFAAISRIRAEVRDSRINCEFAWVRGCLHAPVDQPLSQARATLTQEAAIANALGIDAAYVDRVPGLGRPGVWFDGQARLHPLR
jgi:glycine/D-amino acid oxidase-like deaminating enzyme